MYEKVAQASTTTNTTTTTTKSTTRRFSAPGQKTEDFFQTS